MSFSPRVLLNNSGFVYSVPIVAPKIPCLTRTTTYHYFIPLECGAGCGFTFQKQDGAHEPECKHVRKTTCVQMTTSCRTLLWDTLVGHSSRKLFWDTLTGHSCGTVLWDTLTGHSCGTLLWDTRVGHLWDTLTGHSCSTLL